MKIGAKLVIIITAVNLVCIGGLTISSLVFSSTQIRSLVDEDIRAVSVNAESKIKMMLETTMSEIRAIGNVMSNFDIIRVEARRQFLNAMFFNLITNTPDILGIWAIMEPNVLDGLDAAYANTEGTDGSGRFLTNYFRTNGKINFAAVTNYEGTGSIANSYRKNLSTGKEMILDPYYYEVEGKNVLMTSLAVPVNYRGKVIGMAGVDIALTEIQTLAEQIKPLGDGITAVFSNEGIIVAHPDVSRLGKKMQDTEGDMTGSYLETLIKSVKNGTSLEFEVYSEKEKNKMIVVTQPCTIGNTGTPWAISVGVKEKTVMAPVYRMSLLLVTLGILSMGIITVIILLVTRTIIAPLKSMEKVFLTIGEGDFTPTVKTHTRDEIGNIGRSLNLTLEKIRNLVSTIKNQTASLFTVGNELAASMTETAASINEITSNIQSINGRVINQSATVTETSATMEQIIANIEKLSAYVNNQSASVAESSSAIEEMLANIQAVTDTLVKNANNVNKLNEASQIGRKSLEEVAGDIQEIARESEGLLEINSVMENIASQTNLLSMNAAIEAAHAGEAGKGFAVVADEIRKLAESSGEQSKTISSVLKKIKDSIDKIGKSTGNVLGKFEDIDGGVKTVAQQEENIRNAMEEQNTGSKQILEAIAQLNEITQQVKSGAEEMFEGSKEVIKESKNLGQVTEEITGGMKEMAIGADQINITVNEVNETSAKNKESIDILVQEVSRFKVE